MTAIKNYKTISDISIASSSNNIDKNNNNNKSNNDDDDDNDGATSNSSIDNVQKASALEKQQRREARRAARSSRWGEKATIPGIVTKVPQMSAEQEEIYFLQLKVEEARSKLKLPDLGLSSQNVDDRSPSPEPLYNSSGQRVNTREMRHRKKLEFSLQDSIQKLQQIYPNYVPPADLKQLLSTSTQSSYQQQQLLQQQGKITSKVFIPASKYPHINFVGLCIGPRGMTLKKMEEETDCKIIIRGKGSVKEGKLTPDQEMLLPGADEALHAYITASSEEALRKGEAIIEKLIADATENPDSENSLRASQMTQLAILNGTFNSNSSNNSNNNNMSLMSINNTNIAAKMKETLSKMDRGEEAKQIFTNTLLCTLCGGTGHLLQDCKYRKSDNSSSNENINSNANNNNINLNSEYMSLMEELNKGTGGGILKNNFDTNSNKNSNRSNTTNSTDLSTKSTVNTINNSNIQNNDDFDNLPFINWHDLFIMPQYQFMMPMPANSENYNNNNNNINYNYNNYINNNSAYFDATSMINPASSVSSMPYIGYPSNPNAAIFNPTALNTNNYANPNYSLQAIGNSYDNYQAMNYMPSYMPQFNQHNNIAAINSNSNNIITTNTTNNNNDNEKNYSSADN